MLRRRAQSSCLALAALFLPPRSTSVREPRAQYSAAGVVGGREGRVDEEKDWKVRGHPCCGRFPTSQQPHGPSHQPHSSAPVATQGGVAHTPKKATTLGWRSAAIMLASLRVAREVWSGEGDECER